MENEMRNKKIDTDSQENSGRFTGIILGVVIMDLVIIRSTMPDLSLHYRFILWMVGAFIGSLIEDLLTSKK